MVGLFVLSRSAVTLEPMTWFFLALLAPLLFAYGNHTDKYLLSGYIKSGEVGSIVIFSALFSVLAIPVVLFIQPAVHDISVAQAAMLVATGILGVVAVLFYLYALDIDEASFVTPFYQTIPIFAYVLGYFILGETVTLVQGLGSLVIILGGVALSFEIGRRGIRVKRQVVGLMLAASLLSAVNGVIFKLVAVDKGFWLSLFWGFVGQLIVGLVFLLAVPSYRKGFFSLVQENKVPVLALIALSELLFTIGEGITMYATLLAPVALVLLVNSFQPLFVFVLGVLLTLFLPRLGRESLGRTKLVQKMLGIGLMIGGGYLISG